MMLFLRVPSFSKPFAETTRLTIARIPLGTLEDRDRAGSCRGVIFLLNCSGNNTVKIIPCSYISQTCRSYR